jgi:hypothetical protein
MAKVLRFERSQFGRDGLIKLTRGDDWKLKASIQEEISGYSSTVKLSEADIVGVSGYFPPEDSASERIPAEIVLDACSGEFEMKLAASGTELTRKAENGVDLYLEVQDSDGCVQTIYSYGQPVAIVDQGFNQF